MIFGKKKKLLKELSPRQWKLLFRHFYTRPGVKLSSKNLERIYSGFCTEIAAKYRGISKHSSFPKRLNGALWWHYADHVSDMLNQPSIFDGIFKDLENSRFHWKPSEPPPLLRRE